jgi:hypothetical protein
MTGGGVRSVARGPRLINGTCVPRHDAPSANLLSVLWAQLATLYKKRKLPSIRNPWVLGRRNGIRATAGQLDVPLICHWRGRLLPFVTSRNGGPVDTKFFIPKDIMPPCCCNQTGSVGCPRRPGLVAGASKRYGKTCRLLACGTVSSYGKVLSHEIRLPLRRCRN